MPIRPTTRGTAYRLLAGGEGAVVEAHVAPLAAPPETDFVAVAERFLGTPYLWGGRTSIGLDCSGLVQLSLMAAGHSAPRDTDLQEKTIGHAVEEGARLRRGDLVFWPGHVGIMIDGEYMIHASGHQMAVVIEPLADVVARIGLSRTVRRPWIRSALTLRWLPKAALEGPRARRSSFEAPLRGSPQDEDRNAGTALRSAYASSSASTHSRNALIFGTLRRACG